jgi:hypothetical protein
MTMKMFRTLLITTLLLLALGTHAKANDISLTLDPPGGAISGAAGTTVGWGFTLTNLGTDFAVVTGSDFCVGPPVSPCSNALGTYTDFIGLQFIVAGPPPENSSITQTFDNGLMTGVGSFAINPGATGSVLGEIVLTYDLFSVSPNDPTFDPTADAVSNGNFLTTPASVTVTTPEPGSLLLLASGLVGCLLAKKMLG